MANFYRKILSYLKYAVKLTPRIFFQRLVFRLSQPFYQFYLRYTENKYPSYSTYRLTSNPYSFISATDIADFEPIAPQIIALAENYLNHSFNLLGSGWVTQKYGADCKGFEGHLYNSGPKVIIDKQGQWLHGRLNKENVSAAQEIWRLVGSGYEPIDWQLDCKSGYRWSEKTWYKDIKYGHMEGVDVKVPWELARMQHLPCLALSFIFSHHGSYRNKPEIYQAEFCNQIIDFTATNPPRFGVNWNCTMDVAIRVSNWLLAYDLFKSSGVIFDNDFEEVFFRSVYDHGKHIVNNLEWNEVLRANHYLANIVGLLFVAAYLPRSTETDVWLALAVQEFITESQLQFNNDGSNFEASTSYHRLSAEMVLFGASLILGLPADKKEALIDYDHLLLKGKPALQPSPIQMFPVPGSTFMVSPFSENFFGRLEKMAEFTVHLTKPNNNIAQIGDNDNGRFFKLHPSLYFNEQNIGTQANKLAENHLDHRHLIAGINSFFEREDLRKFAGRWLDHEVVRSLSKGVIISSCPLDDDDAELKRKKSGYSAAVVAAKSSEEAAEVGKNKIIYKFPLNSTATHRLRRIAYPDFGVYLYRSPEIYLAIRCGTVGQNGNGGHAHNDQLAIELNVNGQDVVVDPGTYIYTPIPAKRNMYRSVSSHFAPQVEGREPGSLAEGLFTLGGDPCANCLSFSGREFVGVHYGYGFAVYRRVIILSEEIQVIDYTARDVNIRDLISMGEGKVSLVSFSPGYGEVSNA